ncbi:hypothetical protein WN51_08740 [Melipona quadrifasciata]|uniref:Uncharacterized protein n=1 Tax=Melipona quadrifasciata TaxID=166423 RepID=A0A0N0BBI2_9HYME|nr:hypothetical protein WN51_08740 [Melipona quadrifasciata]
MRIPRVFALKNGNSGDGDRRGGQLYLKMGYIYIDTGSTSSHSVASSWRLETGNAKSSFRYT